MAEHGTGATAYRIEPVTHANLPHWKVVRLAMLLDAPRAFGSTYAVTAARDEGWWRARIESAPAWLAWQGDRPVGSVGMGHHDGLAEDETALIGMWVARPARGTGLGEELIGVVAAAARAQGRRRLVLDVAEENAAARRLYERAGFRATGRTWLNPEHGGVPEVELALDLRPSPSDLDL